MASQVEWIQVVTALIGALLTLYTIRKAYQDLRNANRYPELELKPIATRRLRHQSSLLIIQLILTLAGGISLLLPVGTTQAVVRSYAMSIVSIALMVLSLFDHWDPLTSWFGYKRIEGGGGRERDVPRRRAGDPPQDVELKRRSDLL